MYHKDQLFHRMDKLFSIIVVSLNSGDRLNKTLNSIQSQNYKGYEVIIKDGGSVDGSLDVLSAYENLDIKLVEGSDTGIYDAMNIALDDASGRYIYFLNCGDCLYDADVLKKTSEAIKNYEDKGEATPAIFYGDIQEMVTDSVVTSNPVIDAFACFRNVPCHQACFYDRRLIKDHLFNTGYRVRADYEQFLWCYFEAEARMTHMGFTVARYEGNGYSESREGKKISKEEHRDIISKYMTPEQIFKYRMIMALTFAPLRSAAARSRVLAGPYNAFKKLIYKRERRSDI